MRSTEPSWIGSTQQLVDGWRVVFHWQAIDGKAAPAGLEVRRYNVQEDFPAGDGRPSDAAPEATHFEGFTYDRQRPPTALTPTLLGKSIGWGDAFSVQRARLIVSLEEYADDSPEDRAWAHQTGEVAGRGMVWMNDGGDPVKAGTGTRTDPANAATFRLIANLWTAILEDEQLRRTTTASLMRLLREEHDFPLDPEKESHRTKVQAWRREAERRYPAVFAPPPNVSQPSPPRRKPLRPPEGKVE